MAAGGRDSEPREPGPQLQRPSSDSRCCSRSARRLQHGLVVDAFLCPSMSASDHYPFWQRGWKALCGITDNEATAATAELPLLPHQARHDRRIAGPRRSSTARSRPPWRRWRRSPSRSRSPSTTRSCRAINLASPARGPRPEHESSHVADRGGRGLELLRAGPRDDRPDRGWRGLDDLHGGGPDLIRAAGRRRRIVAVAGTDTITARYVDALDCDGG